MAKVRKCVISLDWTKIKQPPYEDKFYCKIGLRCAEFHNPRSEAALLYLVRDVFSAYTH